MKLNLSIILIASCLFASSANAKPDTRYIQMAIAIEQEYGLPSCLLTAVIMTETAFQPWQIEWNGRPPRELNHKTKHEAVIRAEQLFQARQNIDISIVAWNQTYHPDPRSMSDKFDPETSMRWAAQYLVKLHNSRMSNNNWLTTAGLYHRYRKDTEFYRYTTQITRHLALIKGNYGRLCASKLEIPEMRDPIENEIVNAVADLRDGMMSQEDRREAREIERLARHSEQAAIELRPAIRRASLRLEQEFKQYQPKRAAESPEELRAITRDTLRRDPELGDRAQRIIDEEIRKDPDYQALQRKMEAWRRQRGN